LVIASLPFVRSDISFAGSPIALAADRTKIDATGSRPFFENALAPRTRCRRGEDDHQHGRALVIASSLWCGERVVVALLP
jgi:hypothetical protein